MSTMKHILFTMKGCAYHLLDDEAHVRTMLANATVMANAELLDITSHKFSPFGVTAVALLAESHISIHTWPEKLMAVCDVFTCGTKAIPNAAVNYMMESMNYEEIVRADFIRPLDEDPHSYEEGQ